MAVFHPHKVRCTCGKEFLAPLARSVNAARSPQIREAILKGTFHSFTCPKCSERVTVERPFYYTDLSRHCLYHVRPRGRRHEFKETSRDLDRVAGFFPAATLPDGKPTLRVLFGLDELREKLVAQDAGIDDRLLELLKVLLVYEHPFLTRRARLRLSLESVGKGSLDFAAAYEHSPERFRVSMPRSVADGLEQRSDEVHRWANGAHHDESIYKQPDHWVNMWRWSPQPSALALLKSFAQKARDGKTIDTASKDFKRMLKGMPRGAHLPPWAKKDLYAIEKYARKHGPDELEDTLFEIRFGLELADDWAANDKPDDIATLWQLLDDLPDSNVEGNTKIHEILLGGEGGTYDPTTHDIEIGDDELADEQAFQDVVRHEVGHAVHEMLDTKINAWLTSAFGWRTFESTDAGIDGWVALMGGWGTLTQKQRKAVRGYLRQTLGPGNSWSAGKKPKVPPGDPWNGKSFGPRLAYEKTHDDWYEHFKTWHRANGKAFFLNYWYQTLIAVDDSTLKLVAKMPSDYAAMSHFEFFAELYALYHDTDDPKARAVIPDKVSKWMADNVSAEKLPMAMPARRAAKKDFETITRPAPKR
jgi:hypothetical protein